MVTVLIVLHVYGFVQPGLIFVMELNLSVSIVLRVWMPVMRLC